MNPRVYKIVLYYGVPALLLALAVLLLYHALCVPLLWYFVPAVAGVGVWVRYKGKKVGKILNAER